MNREDIDFSEITKDDILQAFKKYDELKESDSLNINRKQKDYILFYNSKEYPHKYIVGIAYGLKYNQETLDNSLYNSTGNHKRSAEWCLSNSGFELYADTKYKKYLESQYNNKKTISTYCTDLKKAIKIYQNLPKLKTKQLHDIFEAMENETISFAEYDKSQKELGIDDKQLFSTLKTKAKVYKNSLQWKDKKRKFTDNELLLFSKIAEKYSLRSHTGKGLQYFQIYPQLVPISEGVRGCHYEFEIKGNELYLTLHLEDKTYEKKSLRKVISSQYESVKVPKIHIEKSFSDEEIINEFDKIYNKIENIITTHYSNYIADIGEKDMQVKQPLNQILYGPPGTGKTYNTINRALEIVFEKEDKNQIFEIVGKKSEYEKTYNDAIEENDRESLKAIFDYYKERGQIEFVTFHQSYGYEEFVEGIKADIESDDLRYSLEDGIFKKLSRSAERNYINSLSTGHSKKDFQTVFQEQILDKLNDEKLKIDTLQKYFYITDVTDKSILFEKASGNTNHTLSLKSLKKMYELGRNDFMHGGLAVYYQPILDLLLHNSNESSQPKELQNHILIIDEINRGNISKIFGELITLIEPSKRIGKDEEIFLKLPNSSEPFGVPSNLYIIGTMNTADRSIAQIDTALRRRFEFVEMMPQHNLLKDVIIEDEKEIEVAKLLEAINERIEYIYDREHTIGHSYFMPLIKVPTKAKLDEIFRVNIIPLLSEYFYSDWEDICEVLNDDKAYFIKEKELTYKPKKDRGNKVYSVNSNTFEVDGYINIYNGLEQ